ncbi:unnamed protein product [Clonostachys rosea]|uniref:Reverse transcriptase domain-containing protein n=1 Tax=Bionectria ochroleuca TaxID=29856 RepID=A0ABY6UHY5_BIOOC|nr:unnamed protein product [Clonostachys rosea]
MASSEILTETLHAVTGFKITELGKQKQAYESAKQSLLKNASNETDTRKRVQLLVDESEKLPGMSHLGRHPLHDLDDLRYFIEQARFDPSISEHALADYEKTVRNQLDAQTAKYDFAELYGELVKEWTSSNKAIGSDSAGEFVSLGREEMHAQRTTWEEYVFHAKETDAAVIKAYLDELFAKNPSKEVVNEFEGLRSRIKRFQEGWDNLSYFNEEVVAGCIRSILRSDVLADSKRSALGDFLGNRIVLNEIADVMNMRMATRSSFALDGPTVIEQRRQLNGRYRFYPDEDLLQMIFLQYIGLKWAVELKEALRMFTFADDVLKSPSQKLSKQALRRRQFFLNKSSALPEGSVAHQNDLTWRTTIFLDQLPNQMFEKRGAYGNEKPDDEEDDHRASPLKVAQELVQRIQAHLIIQKKLNKDTTVIRSDFKWFGPSIPHNSIFTVLEYFGVQEEWIDLFRKVLEAPITFKDDAPGSEPRIRKRGTPIGTPLASFFGEALLFCVDFAVNQRTDGAQLWRLHDDLWLWGEDESCSKGWDTLTEFSDVMGLDFNEEKTGSCQILAAESTEQGTTFTNLPSGDVVWGFLKLDAASGEFVINHEKVDIHIEELDLQLKACNSVFDFVLAWNLYGSRFFLKNMGKVAGSTTRQHVHALLETFQRVQARVFKASNGSVGQHLKRMVQDRLGVSDIPDGFLYYPTVLGGLGLQNPLIYVNLVGNSTVESSEKFMESFFKDEEKEYRSKKRFFEELSESNEGFAQPTAWDWSGDAVGQSGRAARGYPEPTGEWADLKDEPFMSFEEFVEHREVTSLHLGVHYTRLLADHVEHEIKVMSELSLSPGYRGVDGKPWTDYEKWVIQQYAKEMLARFGGLYVVEKGLLPAGLTKMLLQSRFTWQN